MLYKKVIYLVFIRPLEINCVYFYYLIEKLWGVLLQCYWEKKLQINTSYICEDKQDGSRFQDQNLYSALPYPTLFKMLEIIKLKADDVLVDLGCGAGRVVIFAAREGIKEAIGVELRKSQVESARINLSSPKTCNLPVTIIHQDAADYLPYRGNIFYMLEPFGPDTTKKVLANIQHSLEQNPRQIKILLYHNKVRLLLDMSSFLKFKGHLADTGILLYTNF
ncbi:MAG: class I SAM-dependent methyltransferase [Bacteriovoracaceae bacterium]|nr:class I SAM-dependent methyltransferase [Bacteriovoracaceae bacterium]